MKTKYTDEEVGLSLIALLLLIPYFFYAGWVGQTIWNWHLPQYGLPILNLWQALALMVVLKFFIRGTADRDQRSSADIIADMLISPAVYLFFAWIVK